jgi:hypothetical protein
MGIAILNAGTPSASMTMRGSGSDSWRMGYSCSSFFTKTWSLSWNEKGFLGFPWSLSWTEKNPFKPYSEIQFLEEK